MLPSPFRRLARALLLATIGLTACSSDGDGDGGGVTRPPGPAFDAFCRATLLKPTAALPTLAPGVWGGANNPDLPPGTAFLLARSFDNHDGYVFLQNGTPAKITGDFKAGFVKDVDFATDCASTAKSGSFTLLAPATFHDNEQLTGAACAVPVGASFPEHGFANTGSGDAPAMFSSPALEPLCGYVKGYSKDLVGGSLLTK